MFLISLLSIHIIVGQMNIWNWIEQKKKYKKIIKFMKIFWPQILPRIIIYAVFHEIFEICVLAPWKNAESQIQAAAFIW